MSALITRALLPIILSLNIFAVNVAVALRIPPHLVTRQAEQAANTSKAGLAWPNGPYDNINQFRSTGKVSWYYTWNPAPTDTDLEFVPMLWGTSQVSQWAQSINNTINEHHVTHALGFNEPQQAGQSNMSPMDAAAIWKAQLEPLKVRGIRLGTPAPSSAPSGKQWLLDWMQACGGWDGTTGGCTVDFVALHWYDVNSTAFMQYLEDFHETFQKPIWVTEWACQNFNEVDEQCSQQDIVNFMNATQAFMDQTEWVERYSWFGAMRNLSGVNQWDALLDSEGRITALGQQYISAATPNVSSGVQPGVVTGGKGEPLDPPHSSASLNTAFGVIVLIVAAAIGSTVNGLALL